MLYSQPALVQTAFAEISANVSTTSTSYVDLSPLTLTITTDANPIEVHFSLCAEVVSASADLGFQLLIDDAVVMGTRGRISASGSPGYTSCPSMRYKSGRLTAGSHTVKIQWKTALATTVQVRPANFIYGSGSLLVREVSV